MSEQQSPTDEMPMSYEETIFDIEREFLGPSQFKAATNDELQALSEDGRLEWKWPHTPLTAEISRLTTQIRWIDQRSLRVICDITEGYISRCLRDIPTAEHNVIVKYPGMLRMSTRCLICYGVFSERGCRQASTIRHPNCICLNPVYGRRCITRALKENLCPSCSRRMTDDAIWCEKVWSVVLQKRDQAIEQWLAKKHSLEIRLQSLEGKKKSIEESQLQEVDGIHGDEVEEVATTAFQGTSISTNVNSPEFLYLLEKIYSGVEGIKRAIFSQDMIEAESRMRAVRGLASEVLDSVEVTEASAAAVGLLEHLRVGTVSEVLATWYDDWEANSLEIMENLRSQIMEEKQISDLFDGRFFPVTTLMFLFQQVRLYRTGNNWTNQDFILHGLTLAWGIRHMVETMDLTPTTVNDLQEFCLSLFKFVACRGCSDDLTAEDFPTASLLQNFKYACYESQLQLGLQIYRGGILRL